MGRSDKMEIRKKINPTLFDLCLGIFIWGILCQIVILIFGGMPAYSIGLWTGIVLGIAGAIHMWWTLDRSLDMVSKGATKTVGAQSIIRYIVLVVVMALLAVSGFANPLFAFWGYMGMKAAAYMQPFTRKISSKIFKL